MYDKLAAVAQGSGGRINGMHIDDMSNGRFHITCSMERADEDTLEDIYQAVVDICVWHCAYDTAHSINVVLLMGNHTNCQCEYEIAKSSDMQSVRVKKKCHTHPHRSSTTKFNV